MNETEYRELKAYSQSDLKLLLKSDIFFHNRDKLRKETDEMRFGTAVHKAIENPVEFKNSYGVLPEFWGMTKDGKPSTQSADARAKKAKYLEDNKDKIFIEQSEMDDLTGMLNQVSNSRICQSLLSGGTPEHTVLWEHRGHKLKSRLDYYFDSHPDFGRCVVEIKTTKDASPNGFSRRVFNLGYDFQCEFYRQSVKADRVFIIAIETVFPYAIGVYDMCQWEDSGKRQIELAFDKLDDYLQKGVSQGYTRIYDQLPVPKWISNLSEEDTY